MNLWKNLAGATCLGLGLILAGCGKRAGNETTVAEKPSTDPWLEAAAAQETPAPDFVAAASQPAYRKAVQELAAVFGTTGKPMEDVKGGVAFEVPESKVDALLLRVHTNYLARSVYVFRSQRRFKIGGQPDVIGILPTADKYAVMAAVETDGANYDLTTASLVVWLKKLEAEQPLLLTEIGMDYLAGAFTSPVQDSMTPARRMYNFCPDIVDQGVNSVAALAKELEKGTLYFWWD